MLIGFLIYLLPTLAAISAAIYLPLAFLRKRCHGKEPFARHLTKYALVGFSLCLLYLTILWYGPSLTFNPAYYFLNLTPFVWLNEAYNMGLARTLEQLALNVIMFIPAGLLIPMVFPRLRRFYKTAAMALSITIFIETLQYFIGRSADIDDVLMNLGGGMLGYALYALLNRLCKGQWWLAATGDGGR